MNKTITEMDKNELLDYLKENPNEFESLYTNENISKINWDYIPEELIDGNRTILKNLGWKYISIYQKLSESFIAKHKDWVNWNCISKYQKLSEGFIAKYKDLVYWDSISGYQKLSESFIIEHKDLVDGENISTYQKLSESFIIEHKDLINWRYISRYQKFSEKFISEHKNLIDWELISKYQKLSESFLTKHKNLVDWNLISKYQKLSENFIAEYKNLINWNYVSKYQKLSENFIAKHKNYVNWNYISKYQKLSKGFISKYKIYFNMYNVYSVNDNWLNKSTEFKKEKVINTGLYECHEDYFIAYKGIRSDRYSAYNFQYQYMPGETYECFSDGSDNEASFGLSVWTKESATGYCDELVVKCKIYYEDVTRVVNNDYKIRCSKITILS